jgi:hypothetical protein
MTARWRALHEGLSRFAGRTLPMNEEVLASARETNFRNRSIAWFLKSAGAIWLDPDEAVDLYTMQCSLDVTARDLAIMGATLADGGVNPVTGARVVALTENTPPKRRISSWTIVVLPTPDGPDMTRRRPGATPAGAVPVLDDPPAACPLVAIGRSLSRALRPTATRRQPFEPVQISASHHA